MSYSYESLASAALYKVEADRQSQTAGESHCDANCLCRKAKSSRIVTRKPTKTYRSDRGSSLLSDKPKILSEISRNPGWDCRSLRRAT